MDNRGTSREQKGDVTTIDGRMQGQQHHDIFQKIKVRLKGLSSLIRDPISSAPSKNPLPFPLYI